MADMHVQNAPLIEAEEQPRRKTKKAPKKHATPLSFLHFYLKSFPVQALMIAVTVIDLVFLLVEFVSGTLDFEDITLTTSLMFFMELTIQLGFEGKTFFRFDPWWQLAEVLVVTTSFFVEYTEFVLSHSVKPNDIMSTVRYMRVVRFCRVFIMWKVRARQVTASLRRLVSSDRRRYQARGFDLDLTYVFPNIIAMSWPSERMEGLYRNHIDAVAKFFDETHPQSFRIYNLCSERSYDESKFHYQVKRYRLDDHNPAELSMMLEFARDVTSFLAQNPRLNVAAIHCKGGKGRTGTMTCAYMLFAGLSKDSRAALEYFGTTRTAEDAHSFQGVESPSQDRYVKYFERLMQIPSAQIPQRRVRITSMRLYHLPIQFWDVARLWYAVVLKPNTDRILHYKSNPHVTFSPHIPRKRAAGDLVSQSNFAKTSRGYEGPPEVEMPRDCQPFGGNYIIFYNSSTEALDCATFADRVGLYSAEDSKKAHASTNVTVEINTSQIPPFEGDVCIKFFHGVDMPNTLTAPVQFWFHPSFEQNQLKLGRSDLDGPHKDDMKKHKRFPSKFSVEVSLCTVEAEK